MADEPVLQTPDGSSSARLCTHPLFFFFRSEPYTLVRVERGHVSLEERCSPRFGLSDDELGRLEDGEECEIDYMELWRTIYKEEMEVLNKGPRLGGGGKGKGKRSNEPPPPPLPPTGPPGAGSFSGEPWDAPNF